MAGAFLPAAFLPAAFSTAPWVMTSPLMYALGGQMRGGASRGNYTSSNVFISIDGIHYANGRLVDSEKVLYETNLSITDTVSRTPNRAAFAAMGFVPQRGAEVIVTLGSKNNLRREFGGQIISSEQDYLVDKPEHRRYAVSAIDFTWGLSTRRVTGYYTGSATSIAQRLIALAPGYSDRYVEADLPTIDGGITFTTETILTALTRLCERFGGDWKCDYHKRIHLGFDIQIETPPTTLATGHPLREVSSIQRDLSQWITRVTMEGGGAAALTEVIAGETILPVVDASWYQAGGGVVKSGPQFLTYTGSFLGGGGALVGPGATPSAAPNATLQNGTEIESGSHDYAVTYQTAAGQSLPGPSTTIIVGTTAAPVTAPTAGTPTSGTGPDPGSHDYAVTLVTSAGETTPSPIVTKATTVIAPPTSAPAVSDITGFGVEAGAHDYVVSFVSSVGETSPSPISGSVTLETPSDPEVSAPGAPDVTFNSTGVLRGPYSYGITFVNAHGETTLGGLDTITASGLMPPTTAMTFDITPDHGVELWTPTIAPTATRVPSTGGTDTGDVINFVVTFYNALGETPPSPVGPTVIHTNTTDVDLTNIQLGPSGTTGRRIFRALSWSNPTIYSLIAVIADNTTTILANGWTRTVIGGSPPTVNTTANGPIFATYDYVATYVNTAGETPAGPLVAIVIPTNTTRLDLLSIPIGPTGTTKRRIYRRSTDAADPTAYWAYVEIANNTTTTLTSVVLGTQLTVPAAPTANTTGGDSHLVGSIPTGPTGVTARKIYRTVSAGSQHKFLVTLADNVTTTYVDNALDATLGADAPTTNTTAESPSQNQIRLTSIQTGASGTTSRKIFRRFNGAGTFKLAGTIANNTSTTYTDSTPNASLGAVPLTVSTAYLQRIPLTGLPIGPALVTARKIYRTVAGGSQLKLAATIADNVTTSWVDTITDASLGANVPTVNTATANRVDVSGIPIGPAGVTGRGLFRTRAGESQLYAVVFLADNTTTTYADAFSDASITSPAPVTDLSGLTQPAGVVLEGATSLIVATTGDFRSAGGWAVIGNGAQVVRYTGIAGNALSGIPATGPGAIVATIGYNSTVTAAPAILGIPASGEGSVLYTIHRGDEVNLHVTVNDVAGQAALSAKLDPLDLLDGAAGIVEDPLQDRRIAHDEAVARATAHLTKHNQEGVTIRYQTWDLNSRAGSAVTADLDEIELTGDFTIQSVTESKFRPNVYPLFDVEASNVRVSFDDLLLLQGPS